jgi:hypothetical protein
LAPGVPVLAVLYGNPKALKNLTFHFCLSLLDYKNLEHIKVGRFSETGFQNSAFQTFDIME